MDNSRNDYRSEHMRCQADHNGHICGSHSSVVGENKNGHIVFMCTKHWAKKLKTEVRSTREKCKALSCQDYAYIAYLNDGIWIDLCKYHMVKEAGLVPVKPVEKSERNSDRNSDRNQLKKVVLRSECRYCGRPSNRSRVCIDCSSIVKDKVCRSCNKYGSVQKCHEICRYCFKLNQYNSPTKSSPTKRPRDEVQEELVNTIVNTIYDVKEVPKQLPPLKDLFAMAATNALDVRIDKETNEMIERFNPNKKNKSI